MMTTITSSQLNKFSWRLSVLCVLLPSMYCGCQPIVQVPLFTQHPVTHRQRPLDWGPSSAVVRSPRYQVIEKAQYLARQKKFVVDGLHFSQDQVGFIRAAYWAVGIELVRSEVARRLRRDGVEILYASAKASGTLHRNRPRLGDLIFFQAVAPMTSAKPIQIAMVEHIDQDGTLGLVGYFAKGVNRVIINLEEPNQQRDRSGKQLNDAFWVKKGSIRTKILASKMFLDFMDPF